MEVESRHKTWVRATEVQQKQDLCPLTCFQSLLLFSCSCTLVRPLLFHPVPHPWHHGGKEGAVHLWVLSHWHRASHTTTEWCECQPAYAHLCSIGKQHILINTAAFLTHKSTASVAESPRQWLSTSWSGTRDNYSWVNSCYQVNMAVRLGLSKTDRSNSANITLLPAPPWWLRW